VSIDGATGKDGSILDRIQPHLRAMPGYMPVEPPEFLAERLGVPIESIIKLDANENPYGPSERVLEAIRNFKGCQIYPDPEQRRLRAALSAYTGFPPGWLLAGAGTDELIDLLVRMFVPPGEAIVNFPPTFGMYAFSADLENARLIEIPRRADFTLDLEQIARRGAEASLIFAVSPNNPTGTPLSRKELDCLLGFGCPVVVDEAYAEFSGSSYIDLVREEPNLIVLRTLSKWAGLAGLRVGFMVAAPGIIEVAFKCKQPYSVNVVAEAAAIAAIADRKNQLETVDALVRERERLRAKLEAIPSLEVAPSLANFLLCEVKGIEAIDVHGELRSHGIMVRHYDTPLLQNHIRITVGKPHETDAVVAALAEILPALSAPPRLPSR